MAWGMTMVGMAATTRYLKKMVPAAPDTWLIGPNTDYDVYVEFGTDLMKARPCVERGAQQAMTAMAELAARTTDFNQFLKLLALRVEKEIKEAMRRDIYAHPLGPVTPTGNLLRSVTAEKQ